MLAIETVTFLIYVLAGVCALILLWVGYRIGRLTGGLSAKKHIATREQEMLTAQRGFKTLYEQDVEKLRQENAELKMNVKALEARVEAYRKKAAGFGLFGSAGKRAEVMYALLLENEQLEEALTNQNQKLHQERSEAVQEQIRATGYRRILISQLMNDERIKGYMSEVISSENRLPAPQQPQLPPADQRQQG